MRQDSVSAGSAPRLTPEAGRIPLEGRATFNQVLASELHALRPNVFPPNEPAEPFAADEVSERERQENKAARAANLRQLFAKIGTQLRESADASGDRAPLAALCLSGGGIRSATFNLGVLQGLARIGLLPHFDYLSSVSGGGYIAGWLKAWMRREGTHSVVSQLARSGAMPDNPLAPEPKPIDRLRQYSNYLTPRVGLFSADTWTAAAIVVRNLLLNWLVIVPVLAAAVSVPQFTMLVVEHAVQTSEPGTRETDIWRDVSVAVALLAALLASVNVYRFRRRYASNEGEWQTRQNSTTTDAIRNLPRQGAYVLAIVGPLFLSAVGLSTTLAWLTPTAVSVTTLWQFAGVWCIGVPLLGWLVTEPRWRFGDPGRRVEPWLPYELAAVVLSGGVAAVFLVLLATKAYPLLLDRPAVFVVTVVPILLALYLVSRMFFVAIAGRADDRVEETSGAAVRAGALPDLFTDMDREWWARLSGWILLAAVAWLLLSSIVLVGPYLVDSIAHRYAPPIIAGLGGISGILTRQLAGGGDTTQDRGPDAKPASALKRWALALAAPLFCVSLAVLLAYGTAALGRFFTGEQELLRISDEFGHGDADVTRQALGYFLLVPLLLLSVSLIMSFTVNVNRFSLHSLYRHRLVRAYLGASNKGRNPDPFTGFAASDNHRLHDLWKEKGSGSPPEVEARRPLHVINTSLNLVAGEKLAWQQRKAESFSMSPFYCGNFYEGYRLTTEYGGVNGISLGTAMTISGAAANPNQGYHSSAAVTFLMTLFNARLGVWLGNTNARGNKTYRRSGPRPALAPILHELFGMTNAKHPYINLSDGGHFENLGLYEMVLRRCRFIFVSDASHDLEPGFEDLGNAIRKIRIDFGIPILFKKGIKIAPRNLESQEQLHCALGEICYQDVDGKDVSNGSIIYIKPSLAGGPDSVPYDVFSYARKSKKFPHESTADQWFDESQFESYRALGSHVLSQISAKAEAGSLTSFDAFLKTVDRYVQKRGEAQNGRTGDPDPVAVAS